MNNDPSVGTAATATTATEAVNYIPSFGTVIPSKSKELRAFIGSNVYVIFMDGSIYFAYLANVYQQKMPYGGSHTYVTLNIHGYNVNMSAKEIEFHRVFWSTDEPSAPHGGAQQQRRSTRRRRGLK